MELSLTPYFPHLALSAFLGAIIGLERETARKDASFRTFSLVSLGSCLITILSVYSGTEIGLGEPSRLAAQVISGIGFLGAGVIFRSEERITGLTTAALLWVTAGIGMAVGFNQTNLALEATALVLAILVIFRFIHERVTKKYKRGRDRNRGEPMKTPPSEGLQ